MSQRGGYGRLSGSGASGGGAMAYAGGHGQANTQQLCSVSGDVNLAIAAELEEFGKVVQQNNENIDEKTIAAWKKNMLDIADMHARFQQELLEAKSLLQAGFEELITSSGSLTDLSNADIKAAEKLVTDRIKARCDSYDVNKGALKAKLNSIFKISSNKRPANDDIEVYEQEETESDYKCPVSMKIFAEPMSHATCIHHIDKASLDMLLKKVLSVKCPVVGCSAHWTRDANTALDSGFQYKIKRWQKKGEQQKQNTQRLESDMEVL